MPERDIDFNLPEFFSFLKKKLSIPLQNTKIALHLYSQSEDTGA